MAQSREWTEEELARLEKLVLDRMRSIVTDAESKPSMLNVVSNGNFPTAAELEAFHFGSRGSGRSNQNALDKFNSILDKPDPDEIPKDLQFESYSWSTTPLGTSVPVYMGFNGERQQETPTVSIELAHAFPINADFDGDLDQPLLLAPATCPPERYQRTPCFDFDSFYPNEKMKSYALDKRIIDLDPKPVPLAETSSRELGFEVPCQKGIYPTHVEVDWKDLYPRAVSREDVDRDPRPLPEPIKKEMLGALTLGMSAEVVIKTLLQIVIENQAEGVSIDCYTEDVEDLESFTRESKKYLEPGGFGAVICADPNQDQDSVNFQTLGYTLQDDILVDPSKTLNWTTVGLVDHLNQIKLSTTPSELNKDLSSWMKRMIKERSYQNGVRPHSGDIDLKLIIIIGAICRQYLRYLDLVNRLLDDFFYTMESDLEMEEVEKREHQHNDESLIMPMESFITSYPPPDGIPRHRPDSYIGSAHLRHVKIDKLSDELRALIIEGTELIDQSCNKRQTTIDQDADEAHVNKDEDDDDHMSDVD